MYLLLSFSTSARLQFRLPDGSSVTNTFPADSPLEIIRQYIITVSSVQTITTESNSLFLSLKTLVYVVSEFSIPGTILPSVHFVWLAYMYMEGEFCFQSAISQFVQAPLIHVSMGY